MRTFYKNVFHLRRVSELSVPLATPSLLSPPMSECKGLAYILFVMKLIQSSWLKLSVHWYFCILVGVDVFMFYTESNSRKLSLALDTWMGGWYNLHWRRWLAPPPERRDLRKRYQRGKRQTKEEGWTADRTMGSRSHWSKKCTPGWSFLC